MKKQRLSSRITVQDLQAVAGCLRELRQRLPCLVVLTPAERRRGSRLRLNNLTGVNRSLMAARENPGVLARNFDLAQFEHAVRVTLSLRHSLRQLKTLASDLQDTLIAVLSETIQGSQQVRSQVRAAAHTVSGLKLLAKGLSARAARAPGGDAIEVPNADTGAFAPSTESETRSDREGQR